MLKKRFLCACALMMILISLFSPGAFALENAGSVITEELFLFGGSQGGFISAYVAGTRQEEIAGLILLYPAFNLQEILTKTEPDALAAA